MTLTFDFLTLKVVSESRVTCSIRVVGLGEKERVRRAPRGEDEAPRSSATGARIEASKAPRGVGCGEVVSPCPLPRKFLIMVLNMVSFGAFWVVFFTVHLPFFTQNKSSTAIGLCV